ncbi:hypothetical protein TNCV_522561 [Trichonephila clavipes]|nr:hypothetical protein TNCV_522561 [Trichonephila clavipes]
MAQTQYQEHANTKYGSRQITCFQRRAERRGQKRRARDYQISVFIASGTSRDFRRWMEIVSKLPGRVPLITHHREWCHRHRTWIIEWRRELFTNEYPFYLWRKDSRHNGYGGTLKKAKNQPIYRPSKPVLHRSSWFGVA